MTKDDKTTGTTPQDTKAAQTEVNRRDALFWLLGGTAAVTSVVGISNSVTSVSKGVMDIRDDLGIKRIEQTQRVGLIKDTFFSDLRGEVPLVPGFDQSVWKKQHDLRPNDDIAALKAILQLYGRSDGFQVTDPGDAFETTAGIICTGSPVTNIASRRVMTLNPDASRPVLSTVSGQYELDFVHVTGPTDSALRRRLDGQWLEEPNHRILDVAQNRFYSSFIDGTTREPNNGYLLYSKLPHVSFQHETACVWAGNIGPATEGVRLLLENSDFISFSDLENIYDFASQNRYFQALFIVDDIQRPDVRRHRPGTIRLVRDGLRAVRPL